MCAYHHPPHPDLSAYAPPVDLPWKSWRAIVLKIGSDGGDDGSGEANEDHGGAQAGGAHIGRKPKLTPHQIREALACRQAGEGVQEIALSYNVSHSTISRLKAQI